MRWKRQSALFFGIGIALIVVALSIIASLQLMSAHAHVSPNPANDPFSFITDKASSDESDDEGFVEVDWTYWKEVNPDIIAWVNIPDTKISYPIMRAPTDNPTFYLHHDIYRNYSVYGVPYLDTERPEHNEQAFNAIIYGHNMDDGSMFSDLASYSDEDYARDHDTICLQTPAGKERLCVAFVSIIDGDNTAKGIHFLDEEAFRAWYQEQRELACVTLDSQADPAFIVTFCTCSYHEFSNERTLVVCTPTTNEHT